jgi:hypothetical protein
MALALGMHANASPMCDCFLIVHTHRAGALPRLVSILNSSSFVNVEDARGPAGTTSSSTSTSGGTTSGTVQEYAAAVLSCLSRTTDAQVSSGRVQKHDAKGIGV